MTYNVILRLFVTLKHHHKDFNLSFLVGSFQFVEFLMFHKGFYDRLKNFSTDSANAFVIGFVFEG